MFLDPQAAAEAPQAECAVVLAQSKHQDRALGLLVVELVRNSPETSVFFFSTPGHTHSSFGDYRHTASKGSESETSTLGLENAKPQGHLWPKVIFRHLLQNS